MRATMIFDDSCKMPSEICTFSDIVQIFSTMSPCMIQGIVEMTNYINGRSERKPPNKKFKTYIETQIHGDILIQRDVEHIMLHYKHMNPWIIMRLNRYSVPYAVFGHTNDHDLIIHYLRMIWRSIICG